VRMFNIRSQLVFHRGGAPAVNKIRPTDFLFLETNRGFGPLPLLPAATASGESELSLYSLTEQRQVSISR